MRKFELAPVVYSTENRKHFNEQSVLDSFPSFQLEVKTHLIDSRDSKATKERQFLITTAINSSAMR